MRTIQFFSVAFNVNNKKIGNEVIQRVKEYNLILEEQLGSRKGRRSVLTVLKNNLVTEISRQTRLPLTINSNDP